MSCPWPTLLTLCGLVALVVSSKGYVKIKCWLLLPDPCELQLKILHHLLVKEDIALVREDVSPHGFTPCYGSTSSPICLPYVF